MKLLDSLKAKTTLKVGDKNYNYFSLELAAKALGADFSKLPFSLKILLENLLRNENGRSVTVNTIKVMSEWINARKSEEEITYYPARVLMQDFTGVPAIVDLAAMRDAMIKLNGDASRINPLIPVDLVIDHSVQVDNYGNKEAFTKNVNIEMERNQERYEFLRWGQKAFKNFQVVPPGTGICHQVNLEYLAQVVWSKEENGEKLIYPDTLVGTDSHTTMVNGLAVLGWGVGGIEAEAAMLGQGISMLIPEVIGVKLHGKLPAGTTATDLVLTITNILRKKGVVNKFVEFYGEGLDYLPLADRATIANMAPEYGATCGFFPIDNETIRYLQLSGRSEEVVAMVEAYAKAQGMWRNASSPEPIFTDIVELDLATVEPSLAGPKRPQDRVSLNKAMASFNEALPSLTKVADIGNKAFEVEGHDFKLSHGKIVIAAITSCTNTSNPYSMIAAGLVAQKAVKFGLKSKPWVKTSLAPGSQVVTEYLEESGLQTYLDQIGFDLVGYGCTTCIGNSGPLLKPIEDTIAKNDLAVVSVLSGNRNFEGRIHPFVKANYLASPQLVVAYALAGTIDIDITKEPLGEDAQGKPIYLADIWPSREEVASCVEKFVLPKMFKNKYSQVFTGDASWQKINVAESQNYRWNKASTYINNPPYFNNMANEIGAIADIKGASLLAMFGDSITTDHISPAGNIAKTSPAGLYLQKNNVNPEDFNSYGARRGNHEVMMRGTFANIRLKNEMLPGTEGGITVYQPTKETMTIYDAAMKYQEINKPLIIVAGKEYGTGSSRDWAAKGTMLLGVKAVIAESFERIHRSNLVGMGVIPFTFKEGMNRVNLGLKGDEKFDIIGLSGKLTPGMDIECKITYSSGDSKSIMLHCRLDTVDEIEYVTNDGILPFVVHKLIQDSM